MKRRALIIVTATTLSGIGVGALILAAGQRDAPTRCPVGAISAGPRCCALGQHLDGAHCVGTPARCPEGLVVQGVQEAGCVPVALRVPIPGSQLMIGPSDWEAEGKVQPRLVEVQPFEIDSTEVTHARWAVCARGGACEARQNPEPGIPVTNVTAKAAAEFCHFVGGRLPTSDEWLIATAGSVGRRFPWGATGLVCRRAVFGLVDGPCAVGGLGPEITGMRPDGATPEGVLDLAGNVAEWTVESSGRYVARGGSYRSRVAGELKSWSREAVAGPADHVGFRCAYDATPSD